MQPPNPPRSCKVRCQWYIEEQNSHYKVAAKFNTVNEIAVDKCPGVVTMVRDVDKYRVENYQKWINLAKSREPSRQLVQRQKQWRERHVQEARELERHRSGDVTNVASRRRRSQRRMGTTTVHADVSHRQFVVGMRVRLFHEGRVYGIGWGHRDLEHRRTIVTVSSIEDTHIWFEIIGLRAYPQGYDVAIKTADVREHAICLTEWLSAHPEDIDPSS